MENLSFWVNLREKMTNDATIIMNEELPTNLTTSAHVSFKCFFNHQIEMKAYFVLHNYNKYGKNFKCYLCCKINGEINGKFNETGVRKYGKTTTLETNKEYYLDQRGNRWCKLTGLYEKYHICDKGIVKHVETNKEIIPKPESSGYIRVTFSLGARKDVVRHNMHYVVAMCFVYNPEPLNQIYIDHIDRDKSNNNYTNLRWCTSKDNIKNRQNTSTRDMGIKVLETDDDTGDTKIYKNKVECSLFLGITVSDLTVKINTKEKLNGKTYEKYILNIDGEEWKTLTKFEDTLTVSNKGRIKNKHNNVTLGRLIKKGDPYYAYREYLVHRLVAETFLSSTKPDDISKFVVNHIDGNKLNNWVTNLEWVTHKENNIHAKTLDTHTRSVSVSQIYKGEVIAKYPSIVIASHYTNIGRSTIENGVLGRCKQTGGFEWKKIERVKEIWKKEGMNAVDFLCQVKKVEIKIRVVEYSINMFKIHKFDQDLMFLTEKNNYKSIKETGRETKLGEHKIRRLLESGKIENNVCFRFN